MIKIIKIKAGTFLTLEQEREVISSLPIKDLNDGDKVEVTLFNDNKRTYIFKSEWDLKESHWVLTPDKI